MGSKSNPLGKGSGILKDRNRAAGLTETEDDSKPLERGETVYLVGEEEFQRMITRREINEKFLIFS